jgi:tetratricopeptide (TPR) repeat protein
MLAMVFALATAFGAEPVADKDYWSIQLVSGRSLNALQQHYARAAGEPYARLEQRGSDYILRVGLWDTKSEAERNLPAMRAKFGGAFVRIAAYRPDSIIASADKQVVARAAPATPAVPAPPPSEEPVVTRPERAPAPRPAEVERVPEPDAQQFRQAMRTKDYARARNLAPTLIQVKAKRDARMASAVGSMYLELNQPETATVWFEHAIEWEPAQRDAHLGLAQANLRLNRLNKAEAALNYAKKDNARQRALRGDILLARAQEAYKSGERGASLDYLKQAERLGRRGRQVDELREAAGNRR